MNLSMIFKSLMKRKLSSFLIILQLVLSLMFFIILFGFTKSHYVRFQFLNKLMNTDNLLFIEQSMSDVDKGENINYRNVYNNILSLKNKNIVKNIQTFQAGYQLSFNNNLDNLNTVFVSEGFMEEHPLKLLQGRNFNNRELDSNIYKEIVPIIVGYNFRDRVKVGQELTIKKANNMEIKNGYEYISSDGELEVTKQLEYKVIGIADKDSMIFCDNSDILYNLKISNDIIYIPFNVTKNDIYDTSNNNKFVQTCINNEFDVAVSNASYIVSVNKNSDINESKLILNNILLKNGSTSKFSTFNENYSFVINSYKQHYITFLVLTIILLSFSIIGILATTLFSISARKKEFGIRLSQGADLKNIAAMVFNEISTLCIISLLIVIAVSLILRTTIDITNYQEAYVFKLDHLLMLSLIGITAGIIVVTASIPVSKINKFNVVELIRGKS